LGDIANAGIFSALIRTKTNIGQIKHQLLRENFSYGHFLRKAVQDLHAF